MAGVSLDTVPTINASHDDTIIVVGGKQSHIANLHLEVVELLEKVAPVAQRVGSICTGAFYMAEAGILDGRRATTHWRFAPALQIQYPRILVDSDRIYVNDQNVWTSAGITAGIDMALAMIEADFGIALSKSVARDLLVYQRRSGGQSQFSSVLDLEPSSNRIRDALTVITHAPCGRVKSLIQHGYGSSRSRAHEPRTAD